MNHESYKKWVDSYVRAWNTNDPDDIAALFASDARYFTAPYREPWKGRDEIVKCWLGRKDEPGDAEFTYEVIVATDEVGIVRGRTRYKSDGTDYSNLWEVRLDPQGLCREFVEWWMLEGS